MMSRDLTEEEKEFIRYWEAEGNKQKKWTYMLQKYLAKGFIYSLPIGLFFFMMGYKRRAIVTHAELTIIMICIVFIAIFYAVFKGYVVLDRKESYYQILKMKEKKYKTGQALSVAND